jgi:RNA recognition motif-containing protein
LVHDQDEALFMLLTPSMWSRAWAGGKMSNAFINRHRLPPEVSRVLYVRNLPFSLKSDDLYDIFGKYGAIRQIRVGSTQETRGKAFVVSDAIA